MSTGCIRQLASHFAARHILVHLDEVISLIGQNLDINNWTVQDVSQWVRTLRFFEPDNDRIAQIFKNECVDGIALMDIEAMAGEWANWGLSPQKHFMLQCVLNSPRHLLTAPLGSSNVPLSVVMGIMADLSTCSVEEARALVAADKNCAESAKGFLFGQLIVIGYKQYHIDDNCNDSEVTVADSDHQPVGWSNERFVLRRRKIPNGMKQAPCIATRQFNHRTMSISGGNKFCAREVLFQYTPDPSRDMFHIGRSEANDFVVKGPLHFSKAYPCQSRGPVSRFACRIECERVAPFRVFLFGGGLNEDHNIVIGESAPVWYDPQAQDDGDLWNSFDALTTFGVRMLRPDSSEWIEISVRGRPHALRTAQSDIGPPLGPPYSNEIIDGTIIDICGVAFIYQSPITMAENLKQQVPPSLVIQSLNALLPQCPVLLSSITFSHLSDTERVQRAVDRAERSGAFMTVGPLRIPTVDYQHIEEEKRSYVFPACGHVHGYHKSLEGRPCPLCRKSGVFVPIAFAFQPAICASAKPTCVFNPCGHVASRRVCEEWANRPLFGPSGNPTRLRPHCPFCITTLCDASDGGAFNRLILQSENGGDWEGEDEEDTAHMDIEGHDTTAQACWELYCRDSAISMPERMGAVASEMVYPKWCPQLNSVTGK